MKPYILSNEELETNLAFLMNARRYFEKEPELTDARFRVLTGVFLGTREYSLVDGTGVRKIVNAHGSMSDVLYYQSISWLRENGYVVQIKNGAYKSDTFQVTQKGNEAFQRFFNSFD